MSRVAPRAMFAPEMPPVNVKSSANHSSSKPAASAPCAAEAKRSGPTELPITIPRPRVTTALSSRARAASHVPIACIPAMIAAMSARERARNVVAALVDTYNRKDLEGTTRLYAEGIRLWSPLTGAQRGKEQAVERDTRAVRPATQRPRDRRHGRHQRHRHGRRVARARERHRPVARTPWHSAASSNSTEI